MKENYFGKMLHKTNQKLTLQYETKIIMCTITKLNNI